MNARRLAWSVAAAALVALGGASVTGAAAAASTAGTSAPTTLGGFTISALAESSTITYEQPNLPIPANPSAELDEGYAATTDNFGPSGNATASALYPGQVIASAGPELGTLEPGLPLPPAPDWPVQAQSSYPATPNSGSDSQPGDTMDATSTGGAESAVSQMGDATPAAPVPCPTPTPPSLPSLGSLGSLTVPSAGPHAASASTTKSATSTPTSPSAASGIASIVASSGQSSSGTAAGVATASASASDLCVSILGGLLVVGSVSSTADATSNGEKASLSGTTTVTNASLDGNPITIDGSGIHADGETAPAAVVLTLLEKALAALGVTVTVTNPTDAVSGAQASRRLDGLRVQINLTTLDKEAETYAKILPASVLAQLPLPIPDEQVMVWDIATVDVGVDASPAYTVTSPSTASGATPTAGGETTGAAGATAVSPTSTAPGSFAMTPVPTGGGTVGSGTSSFATSPTSASTPATGRGATAGTSGATGTGSHSADTSTLLPLAFKGIGTGLVALGIVGALALVYGSTRAANAMEPIGGGGGGHDPFEHGPDEHGPGGQDPDDFDPMEDLFEEGAP